MREKVFCVGLQRTGTGSIGAALSLLGYRVHKGVPFNLSGKVQIDDPVTQAKLADVTLPIVKRHTGFVSTPWCLLYRELDAAYPGSKFILTRRRSEAWADSLIRHFHDRHNPTFHFIYGCNNALERTRAHFIEIYERHNRSVLDHFNDRQDDLLVFDLETAEWDVLCGYLDRQKPMFRAFPHRNSAEARERKAARKRGWLRLV